MHIVTVWLLINVIVTGNQAGRIEVVERFPTAKDCQFVKDNLFQPQNGMIMTTRCIQSKIVVKQ